MSNNALDFFPPYLYSTVPCQALKTIHTFCVNATAYFSAQRAEERARAKSPSTLSMFPLKIQEEDEERERERERKKERERVKKVVAEKKE